MFAERGYDATTVADIAEEAEVAPRTVFMYFPSKVDLALSWSDEMGQRALATFAAHPEADFLQVLDEWLIEEERVQDFEVVALAWDMLEANPALRAMSRVRLTKEMELGGAALVRQLGLPAEHPMFAIAGAALSAAIDEYLAALARRGRDPQLQQSLRRFLRLLIDAARSAAEAGAGHYITE